MMGADSSASCWRCRISRSSGRCGFSALGGPGCRGICGRRAARLLVLPNEPGPGDLPDQLITAFEGVTGVALLYYVGHGQIGLEQ
jgi:hypothetical protein